MNRINALCELIVEAVVLVFFALVFGVYGLFSSMDARAVFAGFLLTRLLRLLRRSGMTEDVLADLERSARRRGAMDDK